MQLNDLINDSTARLQSKQAGKASDLSNWLDRANHLKSLFPDLTVKLTGSWVWITGNTRPVKEALKLQGCRWSSNKSAWYLPGKKSPFFKKAGRKGVSWSHIIDKYGEELIT